MLANAVSSSSADDPLMLACAPDALVYIVT
jgi:hypothetical protein